MALYNNITGADLKNQAMSISSDVERIMAKSKYFADKLATISGDDLTALGLSADYQTYLGSMRSDLAALETWYRANCNFIKLFSNLNVL